MGDDSYREQKNEGRFQKNQSNYETKLGVLDEQTGFNQFLQLTMKACNSICGN